MTGRPPTPSIADEPRPGPARRSVPTGPPLDARRPARRSRSGGLEAGETYRVQVAPRGADRRPRPRPGRRWQGPAGDRSLKALHAGRPRPLPADPARRRRRRPRSRRVRRRPRARSRSGSTWARQDVADRRTARRSRPSRTTPGEQANPLRTRPGRLRVGRRRRLPREPRRRQGPGSTGSGSRSPTSRPILVYFQLELLDRDVSANLRVHRLDPASGEVRPYEVGQGPDGGRPRPRARAVLDPPEPDPGAGDLLRRGQRQPPRLHPPDPDLPGPAAGRPGPGGRGRARLPARSRRRLVRPDPPRGEHLRPVGQPPRHRHPLHRLPRVELPDRGEPGRPWPTAIRSGPSRACST